MIYMLIYVDNKKINVNKLESIYIINQKFGDGIIKYNGITLSPNNNFSYYNIEAKSHLILHGLKGGNLDSESVKKDAKVAIGLILNIVAGIILFYAFIFLVGSGLFTTIVEFLFIIIRDLIMGQLLRTKFCPKNTGIKLPTEKFSHKIFRVLMTLIFIIFSILLIFYSVYIFANLIALIFFSTSKKVINLFKGENESEMEILCDSAKNASWVGKITAGIYTGVYYILRTPNGLLETIENKGPFELKLFNPILNLIDISITGLKDGLVTIIPVLGEVVDGYLGAIGGIIETIWDFSRVFRDLGNPLKKYFF